jgi:hypothetical protein
MHSLALAITTCRASLTSIFQMCRAAEIDTGVARAVRGPALLAWKLMFAAKHRRYLIRLLYHQVLDVVLGLIGQARECQMSFDKFFRQSAERTEVGQFGRGTSTEK